MNIHTNITAASSVANAPDLMLSIKTFAAAADSAFAEGRYRDCDTACDEADTLVEFVPAMVATTLPELIAKAEAFAYCRRGDEDSPDFLCFCCTQNTTDLKIASSIIRDLLALAEQGERL